MQLTSTSPGSSTNTQMGIHRFFNQGISKAPFEDPFLNKYPDMYT
jgi:hypothetical protein